MSQQINLYNPLFLKKEKYFSARAMAQALALIALGLAALYGYALWQTRQAERLAQETGAQFAAQRAQLAALLARQSPQERSKLLEAEVTRLEAAVAARRAMLERFSTGELGNTEGFSAYLAAFGRQAMAGLWLTGFGIGEGGGDLRVEGRALHPDQVPAYLRALNNEAVMRGRQVTELKLAARERSAATGQARPGEPERFVEFSFSAPQRAPGPGKPAAKGAGP